jgi:hypothetical protein
MGGFYGSVQLRTADRAAVLAAAEAVARAMNIKCLVGPPLNGWIGVYPEGNGQDHTVGQRIAAAIGGHALHLLVHDDDVLAYWLWHDGQLVDRYWSAPGYFGEENRAEEKRLVGDVERFAFVLGGAERDRLRTLLSRTSKPTFESERLRAVGELLGMRNAVSAYEQLDGGERRGIVGWRRFSEVPPGRAQRERAKRAAEKSKLKAERARLRAEGLLLVYEEDAERLPTATAVLDGFIVVWRQRLGQGERVAQYHHPPWEVPTPPSEVVWPPGGHVNGTVSDRAARRLATAGDMIRIWDRSGDGWRLVAEIADAGLAGDLAISPDGLHVAGKRNDPRELVVANVAAGERFGAVPRLNMDRQIAFSPDGTWLAVAGVTLGVVPLVPPLTLRSIPISGHRPSGANPLRGPPDGQAVHNAPQVDDRAATADDLRSVELRSVRLKAEAVHAQARRRIEAMVGSSRFSAELCFCVGFDALGRWMWVGTEIGLRVYDWGAVKGLPPDARLPPVWAFDVPRVGPAPRWSISYGYVYAAVAEVDGRGVVFGGLSGQLFRMDLSDGRVAHLADVTGGGAISGLTMTADGSALGVCSYLRGQDGLSMRGALEVWDYRRLVDRA